MKLLDAARGSLIAAAWIAGSAIAQQPTMTDVNYAPAEDRNSVGAVMLENSEVIAQKRAFGTRNTPVEVAQIGQGVMQATLAAAREQDGPDTRALGGPPEQPATAPKKAGKKVKPALSNP